MQSKPRRQLADEMDRQRAKLRLTWDQVAERAGISIATLRRLRNDDGPVSLDTMIGVDQALGWEPGHVEARLAGREPPKTKAADVPPVPDGVHVDPGDWAAMTDHERAQYVRIVTGVRRRRQAARGA